MTSQNIKLILAAALGVLLVSYLLKYEIGKDRSMDEMRQTHTVVVNYERIPAIPRSMADVTKKNVYGRFLEENPDIFVDSFSGLTLQHIAGANEVQYIMAFAADRAPDVVYNNMENINTYIGEEFTTPYLHGEIDQWLEDNLLGPLRRGRSKEDLAKLLAREDDLAAQGLTGEKLIDARRTARLETIISPGILGNIYLPNEKTRAMELWSLPLGNGDLMGVNYRTAMLRQSELVDDRSQTLPPDNWDELEQWAIRIALQDAKWRGWLLPVGRLGAWPFPAFLWQAGGRLSKIVKDADGRTRRECALDEQGAINCLTWYQRWATLKLELFSKPFFLNVDGREEPYRVFRTIAEGVAPRYFRLLQRTDSLSYYPLSVVEANGRRQLVDTSHGAAGGIVIEPNMDGEAFQNLERDLEIRTPMYVADVNDNTDVDEAYLNDRLAMRFRSIETLAGERNPDAERRAAFPAGPLYQVEPKDVPGMPGWVAFGPGIYAQKRQVSPRLTQYQAVLEATRYQPDTAVEVVKPLPNGQVEPTGGKSTLAELGGSADTMVRLADGQVLPMRRFDPVLEGGRTVAFEVRSGPIYAAPPKPIADGWVRFVDGLMVRPEKVVQRHGYRIRATLTNAGMCAVNHLMADVSKPGVRHQRNATFRFIRYMTGPVAKGIQVRLAVEQGEGKFQDARDLRMFGFDEIANQQDPQWREFNENVEKYARAVPPMPNYRDFQNQLIDLLNATCLAGKPVRVEAAAATQQANILHFGGEPEQVMNTKRIWAWCIAGVVLLILGGAAVFAGRSLVAIVSSDKGKHDLGELKKAHARDHLIAWIFLGPAVATVLLWNYVPLVQGSIMALYDFHVVKESTFIGMDNWILIFSDPDFGWMMWRTILYVLIAIFLGFGAPIILALLLNEVPRGKVLFRTLFYLPAITSGLIILFMWKQFYRETPDGMLNQVAMGMQRTYNNVWDGMNAWKFPIPWVRFDETGWHGIWAWNTVYWLPVLALMAWGVIEIFRVHRQNLDVDQARTDTWGVRPAEAIIKRTYWLPSLLLFLTGVGLLFTGVATWGGAAKVEPFTWLKDEKWAMLCIILPGIWGSAGPSCLIYLAGLKSIPEEEYEAADLDGAGPIRKTWAITLPRLSALILINFVGAFIGAFQASQNVLVMTGGGPNNQTMIIGLQIWMKAFIAIRFGYATALSWIMGIMLLGFTMIQLNTLKKVRFSTAGVGGK